MQDNVMLEKTRHFIPLPTLYMHNKCSHTHLINDKSVQGALWSGPQFNRHLAPRFGFAAEIKYTTAPE